MTLHQFDLEKIHVEVLSKALQQMLDTNAELQTYLELPILSDRELQAAEKLKAVFSIAISIDKLDL